MFASKSGKRGGEAGIEAQDPIEPRDRRRSVVGGQHLQRQRITGKPLADKALLICRTGDDRAATIEQQDRRTRMLRSRGREVADPFHIDERNSHSL